MNIELTVCDECGKRHGLMVTLLDIHGQLVLNKDGEPFLVGDRSCFFSVCNRLWIAMEDAARQERRSLGAPHKTLRLAKGGK